MRRGLIPVCVAILLSWIAVVRTDFSPDNVRIPLQRDRTDVVTAPLEKLLSQPFHYLGQGRQSFVFVSADDQVVLKLFKRRYITMPWFTPLLPRHWRIREEVKRRERLHFCLHSYLLAEQYLKEETGIFYVHFRPFDRPLPKLLLVDKTSKTFSIHLNGVPFVLQRKGTPFYASITKKNLFQVIESFLQIIAKRISLGIADADHDVEHNFGLLNGIPIHLDPGRFSLCKNLHQPQRLAKEWWSATHRFRDWLSQKHPESIALFDEAVTNLKETDY